MQTLHWRHDRLIHQQLPASPVRDWLLHAGSFMQKLKRSGATNSHVDVLYEAWEQPDSQERWCLGLPARTRVFVREVLIRSNEGVWMFARTVFPHQTLTGKEKQLSQLKSRSLGSKLFRDKTMRRGPFEFALIKQGNPWYTKIHQSMPSQTQAYWARRSVFYLKQKKLLLVEVFLSPSLIESRYVE